MKLYFEFYSFKKINLFHFIKVCVKQAFPEMTSTTAKLKTVWRRGCEVINVAERSNTFEKKKAANTAAIYVEIDECEKELLGEEPLNIDKLLDRMTKLRNLVCEITPNKRNDDEEDDDVGDDYDFGNDIDQE